MNQVYYLFFIDILQDKNKKALKAAADGGLEIVPEQETRNEDDLYLYARDHAAYYIYKDIINRVSSATRIIAYFEILKKYHQNKLTATSPNSADEIRKAKENAANRLDGSLLGMGKGNAIGSAKSNKDLTDEQIRDRQKFFKQCALMMNMHTLRNYYRKDIAKRVENSGEVEFSLQYTPTEKIKRKLD